MQARREARARQQALERKQERESELRKQQQRQPAEKCRLPCWTTGAHLPHCTLWTLWAWLRTPPRQC